MGITVYKKWVSTKDARTRHEHGAADGQVVPASQPFEVGGEKLMFPGDNTGSPWNVYNCRCAMRTVEKSGIEAEPRKIRVRDPITGKNVVVSDMTYSEWLEWKEGRAASAIAEDDAETLKFLKADARDDLKSIVKRSTIKTQNGFSCFPDGDVLTEYVQKVKPAKGYFDVALHGSSSAVGFGTEKTNMSPRMLASVIRHSEDWNGQDIRLLSCNTGKQVRDEYCFAEELANALGVKVKAPNETLYIHRDGRLQVGDNGNGEMVSFCPNQRGRMR